MYAAFDALSPTMQALLMPLEAEHAADYSGFYGEHPPQRQSPSAIHPVIRLHPETKLPALYVNKGFTKRICGLTNIESKEVLSMLFDHIKNPNFQCRFQWQRDSMALWDNRCTQHMAVCDYFPETRSGVRVTIKGERPIAAR
jgi:taurine dioxygenase